MGLGIRYIQGCYFYKPMSAADFEALIAREGRIDVNGFEFKANEEFRIREFLNDTVYTDSMLNHIIGPAAIYALHGDEIDIIRFNQMLYQAVNVPDFHSSFYGAARDMTEITNLYRHMQLLSRFTPRTVLFLLYNNGKYAFEVTAHGLESDMGLSRTAMEEELNTGVFCQRLIPATDSLLWSVAQECAARKERLTSELVMNGSNGSPLHLIVEADYVDEELGDVRCILSMRKKENAD